jgi:L-ascorbate metabolism protein UlaG (beta-lactamase superfamily)
LLADIAAARRTPDALHLWWLGQSGFLLQWQGRHLLFDPYLSDSLTRKYAGTDKPHVRMTERVIAPERLDFVDVVTSTHSHTDHLDAETLMPLMRVNPDLVLVIPEANRQLVGERLGCEPTWPVGLNDGGAVDVAGFRLYGVPAAHETLEQDELGRHRFLGYVVRAGAWTVYHSGDTLWYPQLVEKVASLRPGIALLPINGHFPERRVAGNLDGREAAELAYALGVQWVIPCHFDLFEFNTATPDEFVATCRRLGQPYVVLRNGERWSVT